MPETPRTPISTSLSQGKRGPTVVEIPGGAAGLPRTSFAVCHQATTLDRAKLARRIGALPPEVLREVEGGLKVAMDLAGQRGRGAALDVSGQ